MKNFFSWVTPDWQRNICKPEAIERNRILAIQGEQIEQSIFNLEAARNKLDEKIAQLKANRIMFHREFDRNSQDYRPEIFAELEKTNPARH